MQKSLEIYNIDSKQIDVHNIDLPDNSFDVVLCSETLEHVYDLERASNELLRVAKKAVIITVPNESEETVEMNKKSGSHIEHIHTFNEASFSFLENQLERIECKRILHPLLNIPSAFVEAKKKDLTSSSFPPIAVKFYNAMVPILRMIFGDTSLKMIIKIDELLSKTHLSNFGYIFVLIKDSNCSSKNKLSIRIKDILKFVVPHHYL